MSEVETAEAQMTLMDHLAELRTRLIRSFIAIGVGAVLCWIFYDTILDFLLEPYCGTFEDQSDCKLFVQKPTEPFTVKLTVSGYGGLGLALPVVLWQIWRFIAPGL